MNNFFKKAGMFTIITSIFLSGCASMPMPSSEQYPEVKVTVDPDDPCERYRQPLRQAEQEQRNALSQVAGQAIVAGIATFALCKVVGGENKQCLAVGGGATLIGGLVGMQQAESNRQATQADLLRGIDQGSASFSRRIGTLGSAAHQLHQCRQEQISSVKSRFKKRRIDRQIAKDELVDIESKLAGDQQLINALLDQNHQLIDSQLDARAAAMNLRREEYVPTVPKRQQIANKTPSSTFKPQTEKISKPKDETQKLNNKNSEFAERNAEDQRKTQKKLQEVETLLG